MRRVVVDPNVLISAFLGWSTNPRRVVEDIAKEAAILVASEQTFQETKRALEKPYFAKRSSAEQRAEWVIRQADFHMHNSYFGS